MHTASLGGNNAQMGRTLFPVDDTTMALVGKISLIVTKENTIIYDLIQFSIF